MLRLENYDGKVCNFEGTLKDLIAIQDQDSSGSNPYWFTDSDLATMDSETYGYVTKEHFYRNGRYCKYELIVNLEDEVKQK